MDVVGLLRSPSAFARLTLLHSYQQGQLDRHIMWDQSTIERLRELRHREAEGSLDEAGRAELAGIIQRLDEAEAALLSPSTGSLIAERLAVETQNEALRRLLEREEALAARIRAAIAEARAERSAIEQEAAQILAVVRG
jgi:hypothetical protein